MNKISNIALSGAFKWLLLILFFGACSGEQPTDETEEVKLDVNPLVLYLVDSEFDLSVSYSKHLEKVFDYTKIPYANILIPSFNNDPYIDEFIRVIYINNTQKLTNSARESLLEFVALGGTLVFPSLNEDQKGGFLSGVKPGADYNYDLEDRGIHFLVDMLPGIEGKTIYPLKNNTGLVKESFIDGIKILATSASNPEQPLIFEHNIGSGRVIHFNTNLEFERSDRGLLFSAALKGLQGLPYPIVNVSSVFIDDFPNPLYNIESEPIKSEFGINQAEFVLDVWWPDMLVVADRFDINYSVYPCFNYDRIKEPPFIFREWDLNKTVKNGRQVTSTNWMVKQVLDNQFELAFHGYNHESLNKETWGDTEFIEGALLAARKKWRVNGFGSYPISYVPPSNEIDSIGLVHLANAMPELKYMSSIYTGELYEGGAREFDIDPFEPRLFDFPRVTSGYTFDDLKIYNQESLYLFTGIWTHFIHPDDVFQLPDSTNTSAGDYAYRNANKQGWHDSKNNRVGLLQSWTDYLQVVIERHPSTRFLNVSSGAEITRDWRLSDYEYRASGDAFSVSKVSQNTWSSGDFYWNIFSEKTSELKLQEELNLMKATYTKTNFFGGILYTVKTLQPQLNFRDDVKLRGISNVYMPEVFAEAKSAYDDYATRRDQPYEESDEYLEANLPEPAVIIEDSVAWYVANENLRAATNMLLERLQPQNAIDNANFDEYILYLAYQESSAEVWQFLENTYLQKSPQLAFQYLDYYLTKEAFPTEELNELWLRRKLDNDPGNIDLVNEYIKYFYAEDYIQSVKPMLQELRENNNSEEAYALYIRFLIDFEPELLTNELKGKNPEQYPLLRPMATTITYAYADEGLIQQALVWAEFSDEIEMKTKLQWWIDLEAFNKMETVYLDYIKENPTDYEVMAFVSNTWYDLGEYERGALIANQLPEATPIKDDFKKRMNTDVRTFLPDVQKFLLVRSPELIYSDTLEAIQRDLRYSENNSIQYNTDYVVDNFNQSVWNNSMTYNIKTPKLNQHSLSVSYSDVSDLNLNSFDTNNVPHSLYGFKYRYQTRENTAKPIFYALAGLEQDDVSNTFITLGAGVSISNEKSFRSLAYTFSPVKTGPAISRKIYWGQLIGYYERGYDKTFQTSFSPVISHYTTGAVEGAITGRVFFNTKKGSGSRFSPYVEAFVSGANENQENGNPYWIIDGRFYGGGGLAWTYGRDQSRKLYVRLEAGAFYDSYTDNFLRLTGNFAFPVKQFTYITGQFEFFNQALYYSNGFQFGIKHFFNRRKEYAYKPRDYEEWY